MADTNIIKLSKEQVEQVQKTGSMPCPNDETMMVLFPFDLFDQNSNKFPHAAKKPELYCDKCRTSAPLFEGRA